MPKKSTDHKLVRKSARAVPPSNMDDLDQLRAAMRGPIDTSDIPERRKLSRLRRDAHGQLPQRKSIIRDAVAQEMKRLHRSIYRPWRMAKVHYSPMSQSAVHEFLKGRRQLELPLVEALMAAVELRVVK